MPEIQPGHVIHSPRWPEPVEVKLVEENEWFKAGRFGQDYYLYAVLNAATQPELYVIQDPAANLQPQERMEVRYLVGVKEIVGRGQAARP